VEILLSRQKKAELLKKMTDVAVRMSEEQLVELRADIKVKLPSSFIDSLDQPAQQISRSHGFT
jgi:hypothetical protein